MGSADETGAKPYGFQATPIGARFGRQFGYFVELGFGYKGIIHGGAAFRFPRILAVHKHCDGCEEPTDGTNEDNKDDRKDDKE